jgi:hypothetical protein
LKNLHGVLHGMQWILFMVYWILRQAHINETMDLTENRETMTH